MTTEIRYGIVIYMSLMLCIVGFAILVGLDPYTDKKRKKYYFIIIGCLFSLLIQNYVEYWLVYYRSAPVWRTFVAAYGYSIRPVMIVMFALILSPRGMKIIAWCLAGINSVMYLTSYFTHVCFYIDENNHYSPGPLYFLSTVVCGVLIAYLVFLCIFKYKATRPAEIFFHLFWIAVIIAGIVADALFNYKDQWVDYITIAITGVVTFSYVWMHQKFVYEYQNDFMSEQRIRVIRSQIQPHFIYNTLSSIRNIEGNPEETKRAITEFAGFIRGNLAALDGKDLIPFKTEMEYIKDYIALQQRRFPDKISVIYEIEDEDFSIPPLTVQILVENAIKHGLAVRYENGTITIKSYCEKKYHVVKVIDDGVGFDPEMLKTSDRVGLRAVKNRLDFYQSGILEIESEPGKGTCVTIKIPIAVS
ncbi:MAG: histidine kinase [Clostridia bacterium]|nr:histidine kinase [Clostridia bacterium]